LGSIEPVSVSVKRVRLVERGETSAAYKLDGWIGRGVDKTIKIMTRFLNV